MKFPKDRYPSSYALDQRIEFFFFSAFNVVILVITLFIFFIIFFFTKSEIKKDLSTLANLVGINCAAPILFSDQKAAQDILAALQAIPSVKAAYVIDETHQIFARYDNFPDKRTAAFFSKRTVNINEDEFRFFRNSYYLISPITFEGKVIGSVYIESDLAKVYSRLRWFAVTSATILSLIILIIGFLFRKLDSAITALKESENRYRRVFENTGAAMFICDENDTISMANAMFEKFTGLPREDIEGKVTWRNLAQLFNIDIKKSSDKGSYDVIWPGNKPGNKKFFYAKTDFLPGTRHRIVSVIDITDIKKAEEELRKSEKLKTEFIYITSHELRTPIQSMLLGVSDLLEAEEIKKNSSLSEDVELVSNGVKRLAQLVENLLDLSQIETNKTRFIVREIPVNQIIDHVMKEVIGLAEHFQHQIRRFSEWPLVSILADKGKIEQVFMNLIGNAIKFTPAGGTILLDCKIEKDTIWFSIVDNGYGIPEYAQKDIFKKFFQADLFMPDHVGGIGLGLTICKHIVEGHGGEITCLSPIPEGMFPGLTLGGERKGCVFTFSLPMGKKSLLPDKRPDDFKVVKAE